MEPTWLYALCECVLCVSVIVLSVRMCMGATGRGGDGAGDGAAPTGGVASCLKLCLGWVGAVGGAAGVPVSVLLNLRSPQCLYTCITLVCCPLLVRQFTMFLLLLLTLDGHLRQRIQDRSVRRRQTEPIGPNVAVSCFISITCVSVRFAPGTTAW